MSTRLVGVADPGIGSVSSLKYKKTSYVLNLLQLCFALLCLNH